jgi:hypothetical protein
MPDHQLKTPILFLVFNRLDTTKLVFEKIRLAKPERLYIAADGPRASKISEAGIVEEIRNWIIENITWECEFKTLFRTENLGCGKAVSSGITWFFENEEMGIILEDDCLVDETFFWYCDELLHRYKDDVTISSICASNTISDKIWPESSYFFSKYSMIWGWATWRRAWKYYDFEMLEWPDLKKTNWLKSIKSSVLFNIYWTYVFDACYTRRVDTWDYQWINASWRQKGLSIIPSVNLIRNIGIGNNSTHEIDNRFSNFIEQKIAFPLNHPTQIKIFDKADKLYDLEIFKTPWYTYLGMIFIRFRLFKKINNIRKQI